MPEHRDMIDRLLCDGRRFDNPSKTMLECASQLGNLGIITVASADFVKCADPLNTDAYAHNRTCSGRIYLDSTLDSSGHDFRCPACDRVAHPFRSGMNVIKELRVKLVPDGVRAYVRSRMTFAKEHEPGVFEWSISDQNIRVCIAGVCDPSCYTAQPSVVVVASRAGAHSLMTMPKGSTILHVADLITATRTLRGAAEEFLADVQSCRGAPAGGGAHSTTTLRVEMHQITINGVVHKCALTAQVYKFLRVGMPREAIAFQELMDSTNGAIWPYRYSAERRGLIRAMVNRANNALAGATPPIDVRFSVCEGFDSIKKLTASPQNDTSA